VSKFHDTARPHVEAVLEPGEELRGFVAATQQSMFKGRLVALAATNRRLIVLPLNRRIEPGGEPISIAPDQIASAKAGGGGGWGAEPTAALMDKAAAELKIKTTDGEKLKLMMMRGEGPGPLAGLGGGEDQRQGLEAIAANLAKWL
jgi:hypothetical protein